MIKEQRSGVQGVSRDIPQPGSLEWFATAKGPIAKDRIVAAHVIHASAVSVLGDLAEKIEVTFPSRTAILKGTDPTSVDFVANSVAAPIIQLTRDASIRNPALFTAMVARVYLMQARTMVIQLENTLPMKIRKGDEEIETDPQGEAVKLETERAAGVEHFKKFIREHFPEKEWEEAFLIGYSVGVLGLVRPIRRGGIAAVLEPLRVRHRNLGDADEEI